jgi:L-ascorbate metabolism protein UlaG (beta-lactamase superfamily)
MKLTLCLTNAHSPRCNVNVARRDRHRTIAHVSRLHICLALFLLIGLGGCGNLATGLPVSSGGSPILPTDPAYNKEIQINYLGAGGVLFKRGDDVILTAPFFSNPSIPRVAFGHIEARPEQIDHFLKPVSAYLAPVDAVLVGHAHYDHLMDIPYIKKNYLPSARIYGSDAAKNTLLAELDAKDLTSVQDKPIGESTKAGHWWYVSKNRIRFMALKSEHAPVFLHLKFFEGNYEQPLKEIPRRATGWVEGQTLGYLIDFLNADGKVDFRIHYQDSASTHPLGFPPPLDQLPDPRPVDLAIICMPGFDQVPDFPEEIVKRLQPHYVVVIHWENFFRLLPDDRKDLRTLPTVNAEGFIARLDAALKSTNPASSYTLPARGAWLRFVP